MSRKWLLVCLSSCFFDKIDCSNENYSAVKLSSSPNSVLFLDDYMMKEEKQKNTKPSTSAAKLFLQPITTRDRSKSVDSDEYGLGVFLGSPKFKQHLTKPITKPNLRRDSSTSSIQSHDSISAELDKSGNVTPEDKSINRIRSTSPIRECNTPVSPSPIREIDEDKIGVFRKISSNSLIPAMIAITIKNQ